MMTVKEYIEKLSKMPQDAIVAISDEGNGDLLWTYYSSNPFCDREIYGYVDEECLGPILYTVAAGCGEKVPDGAQVVIL